MTIDEIQAQLDAELGARSLEEFGAAYRGDMRKQRAVKPGMAQAWAFANTAEGLICSIRVDISDKDILGAGDGISSLIERKAREAVAELRRDINLEQVA